MPLSDGTIAAKSDASATVGLLAKKTIDDEVYLLNLLADSAGEDVLGQVAESPAANSVLGRLKAAVDALGSVVSALQGTLTVNTGLTDAELRAADVPVTLDGEAIVLGAGAASIGTLGANSGVTIGRVEIAASQSLTANAGTNLNTSALALESGGNLARLAGKYVDYDTGAGTDSVVSYGLLLPADGGAVIGGTASNPIRFDPTGSTTQPVSAASLPLPTGAATADNQTTANGLLATIDGDTGSIATAAATIAGDTTSLDSKITACNTGAVVVSSSALPDGAATAANQATANGSLASITTAVQLLDNVVGEQSGSPTTHAVMVAGLYGAGPTLRYLAVDINGVLQVNDASGNLTAIAATLNVMDDWDESDRCKVNLIAGQAGITAGAGAVSANTPRVTLASDDPAVTALETLAGCVELGQVLVAFDGVPVVSIDSGTVSITGSVTVATHAVTQSGTWNVGTVTTVTTCSTVTSLVGSSVAHDAADSGNPHKIGGKAHTAEPTAVANADRVNAQFDASGKLMVSPALPELLVSGTASATNTADTQVIAAQGAGVCIYVTTLIVANTTAVDDVVVIKSGTTARLSIPAPANTAAGGAIVSLPVPLRLAANEALQFAATTGGSTITVSAVGYKGR